MPGGGDSQERGQDLAARMREAWAAREAQSGIGAQRSEARDGQSGGWSSEDRPEDWDAPKSLADRLREAAKCIDTQGAAARAAELQKGHEAEEQNKAREAERVKAEELERKVQAQRGRDHGLELE